MTEEFKMWKGLSTNLPAQANRTPGHVYHCTDTKETYLVDSNKQFQLFSSAPSAYIAYGTCSTAAATAAKVITIADDINWQLTAGSLIVIKFSATNTANNPTFNVNGTGAKPIWYNTALITSSSLSYAGYANPYGEYVYDGTQFIFIGWSYDSNSTYSNASLGQGYGTCSTAGATIAKTVSLSSYSLSKGGVVAVKFTNAVPANATMNINGKGARSIYYQGKAIVDGIICAGEIATFIYDGTYYHLLTVDRNRFFTSLVPMGIAIPAEADLNTITYLKVGNYYCSSNATTKTLLNCPTVTTASDGTKSGVAFMLTVAAPLSQTVDDESGTWRYRLRTLQAYNGPTYMQYCYSNGTAGNWIYGSWEKIARITDIPTKLPNPKSLTFTGSADVIYDGSVAKEVNLIGKAGAGTNAEIFNDSANIALGTYSHSEGRYVAASGQSAHAEGEGIIADIKVTGSANAKTYTLNNYPTTLIDFLWTGARLYYAPTNTYANITDANVSLLSGTITLDTTLSSSALSQATATLFAHIASGKASHVEGYLNAASGYYSHAEGQENGAVGASSHAEGTRNLAIGHHSHAEGSNVKANGSDSHAEGQGTIAEGNISHVQGKYNIKDTEDKYAHIVGNGQYDSARSNAHTLDWSGNAWFAGSIKIGGANQDDAAAKTIATIEDVQTMGTKIQFITWEADD